MDLVLVEAADFLAALCIENHTGDSLFRLDLLVKCDQY